MGHFQSSIGSEWLLLTFAAESLVSGPQSGKAPYNTNPSSSIYISVVKQLLDNFRVQLEASGVSLPDCAGPAVHLGDHPRLRVHPGPGGRLHRHPSHLRLPTLLLYEARRHGNRQQGMETEVGGTSNLLQKDELTIEFKNTARKVGMLLRNKVA
jgi:hypothetical protein